MKRPLQSSPRSWGVVLGLFLGLVLLFTSRAHAQLESFQLDRFAPGPALNDGLALSLPSTLGHLRPSIQLLGDYARKPLVTSGYGTDAGDVNIVLNRMNAHLVLALGLGERGEVFAHLPVVVFQQGDEPRPGGRRFNEASTAGLSDLTLGGSYHLLGESDRGASLGINAALSLPTGSGDAFASDGGVGARGALSVAQIWKSATLAFETGLAYRPENDYGQVRVDGVARVRTIGSEWLYRAGLHVPVGTRTRLMLELNGASSILARQFFKEDSRPLEALLGARAHVGGGFYASAAAGLGLLSAPGIAVPRAILGLGYMPTREPERAAAPEAAAPEPVAEEPLPSSDKDGDGLTDTSDQCPSDAEDSDGFEDNDGCPDEDDDRDGVPDEQDRCKKELEDMDGDRDDDGCPEEPALITPAPAVSPAPLAAAQPSEDDTATPPAIHFDPNTAGVSVETRKELWAAARWLARHPGKYNVTIEGHASAEGSEERNQQLSRERALAVSRWFEKRLPWLKGKKVSLTIEAVGKSSSEPIASNDTEEGRQQNRRVEIELAQ